MVSRRAGQSVVTLALLSALISWSGWDEFSSGAVGSSGVLSSGAVSIVSYNAHIVK